MANHDPILLTRIDNRLVHGQVGVTWTSTLGANLIVVADDQTAENSLTQKLMESITRSSNTSIHFYRVDEFAPILPNAADDQKIFLVVRTPMEAAALQKAGVILNAVNIGNMHYSKGKKPLNKKVYLDASDRQALLDLLHGGSKLFIQDVPGAVREDINEEILNRMEF
ncbi:MAG: PTS sugar transporter subunit IIB [Solobacterium sp.]|jgi:PTS system galactosamine-specific IIB component|nr:PTS sugar transporter subunit IIB [Solobacterium sp.]MCH4221967.1 PTS sugar transporter subunit IIB [Solobacterium sp.]MCH4265572.1 PTS sugar transporter subunit IIB [Solobacterium sp.]